MEKIRVGLVGAGWWANEIHAPMHKDNVHTELVAVCARNPNKARAFAEKFSIEAFDSFDDMLAHVDAVDFAVPPNVQSELATRAAHAGKSLILDEASRAATTRSKKLAQAIATNNVPHIVCFTNRYSSYTRNFVLQSHELAEAGDILTLQGRFIHDGMLGGGNIPSEGTWRNEPDGILRRLQPQRPE